MTTTTERRTEPIEILLVEDNPADIRLTREMFAEGRVANHMSVARSGDEAVDFLYARPPFEDRAFPDLVLLDLNLPGRGGREVLAMIKGDPRLRQIPVVVLSSTRAESDVRASYQLHANCFISKPSSLSRFMDIVRTIEEFWLSIVRLPPHE